MKKKVSFSFFPFNRWGSDRSKGASLPYTSDGHVHCGTLRAGNWSRPGSSLLSHPAQSMYKGGQPAIKQGRGQELLSRAATHSSAESSLAGQEVLPYLHRCMPGGCSSSMERGLAALVPARTGFWLFYPETDSLCLSGWQALCRCVVYFTGVLLEVEYQHRHKEKEVR